VCVRACVCVCVRLSVRLCPSVCLLLYPIYLSICLSICMSVCLSWCTVPTYTSGPATWLLPHCPRSFEPPRNSGQTACLLQRVGRLSGPFVALSAMVPGGPARKHYTGQAVSLAGTNASCGSDPLIAEQMAPRMLRPPKPRGGLEGSSAREYLWLARCIGRGLGQGMGDSHAGACILTGSVCLHAHPLFFGPSVWRAAATRCCRRC
jgi:hypothetical protein